MFKTILIPQDVPRKDALFCILKSLQEIDDASNELFVIFNTRITACKKRLITINRRIDVVCRKADSIKEVETSVVLYSPIKFFELPHKSQPVIMKPTLLPCQNYSIEDSRASPRLLASSTHIRDSIGRKKNYIYSFLKPKFFEMVSQKVLQSRSKPFWDRNWKIGIRFHQDNATELAFEEIGWKPVSQMAMKKRAVIVNNYVKGHRRLPDNAIVARSTENLPKNCRKVTQFFSVTWFPVMFYRMEQISIPENFENMANLDNIDIAKNRTNAPIVSDKYSCLLIDEKKLVDEKIGADPFSMKESELYPDSLLIFDELKQDKVADSIITKPLPKSIKSFEFPDFLQLPGVIKNRSVEHFSDHMVSRTESQASLEPISESLSINVSTNQKEREKSIKVPANEPVVFQKDEEATSSSTIESNVVQVSHPPPPPPPPPPIPPPLLTTNNTSLPSLDEGRSNLMEAIRAAGGTGKVKLKRIEPKQTPIKTQEPASRMVVEDATDDLMASLQKALDKRRRGISGRADKFANLENKKRSGNSQNSVEPLSRLREVIPAPQQQQHSSMKFSSDDEDWR